jgi:uncharacterized protein (DUF58 family)
MPDWDALSVRQEASRLRLGLDPRRRREGAGARLGAGPGASLEFHDHRAYLPGDDLRHLDWAASARTGALVLRRHRREVMPRLEILVDGSASMDAHPGKLALATGLAALIATLASDEGLRPQVFWCAAAPVRLPAAWAPALRQQAVEGAVGLAARPPALMAGADRVLVSDGLHPGGGPAVVRALGAGAGRIALIQVLAREELAPPVDGPGRLEDVEGGAADLIRDATTVAAYRDRLARHQAAWAAALAGRGAGMVTVAVEDGWQPAIRALLRAGLVVTGC